MSIPFFTSLFIIIIAEIGDKTQLLIMSMARKDSIIKILLGVAIGTLFSHGIAILLGGYISNFESIQSLLQNIAYTSFILIGLFSLIKKEKDENSKSNIMNNKYGIVLSVATAIFVGELGDKTQLASIALSSEYPEYAIALILGAICGMILADLVGIILGIYLKKKLPQKVISKISAIAFILFGIIGLINSHY